MGSGPMMLRLFNYWRSSAAYRVRIGLALKGVDYAARPINILPDQDQQFATDFVARNPLARVPVVSTPHGDLNQSLAILEWLEETVPTPRILPPGAWDRARVRAFALTIACDIHPLNNLAVQKRIRSQWGDDPSALAAWGRHWVEAGCEALEALLAAEPRSAYAFGDAPGLADICLVPQLYNARRLGVGLEPFPTLLRVDEAARRHPAFIAAAPERQPDAPAVAP